MDNYKESSYKHEIRKLKEQVTEFSHENRRLLGIVDFQKRDLSTLKEISVETQTLKEQLKETQDEVQRLISLQAEENTKIIEMLAAQHRREMQEVNKERDKLKMSNDVFVEEAKQTQKQFALVKNHVNGRIWLDNLQRMQLISTIEKAQRGELR